MDDRKRLAPDEHVQITPKAKRQAVTVNGAPGRSDEDFPRDEELDRFQKDAILRQMREYKREKVMLEQQLIQVNKRSEYHDEHLRVVDSWFSQLLDELALLQNHIPSEQSSDRLEFRSALLLAEPKQFEAHLSKRAEEIKAAISHLFASGFPSPPDSKELQERLAGLLAKEKAHTTELARAVSEKETFEARLEKATLRYLNAEKQLDRTKSSQVAKLDAQAVASSRPEAALSGKSSPKASKSGDGLVDTGPALQAAETGRQEAEAVSAKQKEQVERLAEENKKLTEELTIARTKFSALTEDDYANTDLFKTIKAQHVDVIKRINDLEAKNIELREEAKKLHAERTEYREKADDEIRNTTIDMQSQLAQTEADLARIRSVRDDLLADQQVRKAGAEQYKKSFDYLRELAETLQSRVSELESELERLRMIEAEHSVESSDASTDPAVLQAKLKFLESEKSSLEQELRSMEVSYKKTSALATLKVNEVTDSEEKIARLQAEKAKADQKYFATMKLKESREWELKTVKDKNDKSSQIISQLKEAETTVRLMLVNTEKQLAEAKDSLQKLTIELRKSQQTAIDNKSLSDQLTSQTTAMKGQLKSKDEALAVSKKSQRDAEVKVEELTVRLEKSVKDVETWKKKASSNQNEDYHSMKKLCWCTVCDKNIKDTVLSTCRHVMCKECIDKQLALRQRRCPICGKAFGANDHLSIVL